MKRLPAFVVVIAVGTLLLPFLMVQGQEQTQTGGIRRVANPIPGQYIVAFKDATASPDEKPDRTRNQTNDRSQDKRVEALAADLSQLHNAVAKHVYTSALKGFTARMTEEDALALSRDPRVEYVEEDGEVAGAAFTKTRLSASRGLDRIDPRGAAPDGAYTGAGTSVNVYVIDSGIMNSHADFGGRAINVFDVDGGSGADCNGHGTHVAGIVGGSAFGVARNVRLYGVRVLDCNNRGSNSDVIEGVDWVTANHVKPTVASLSLGTPKSRAIDDAVRTAIASGVHFVVSAGNGNQDAGDFSPARVEQAITVGSVDDADKRAFDSNYGSALDVFAPGVSIASCGLAGDTDAVMKSGTSMAAAHVAGIVALMLEEYPDAAPYQIESLIQSSATRDVVIDPGKGSANRLLNPSFAALGALQEPDFEGVFESADCRKVSGWAWDKNAPYSPIHVDMYIDGTKRETVWATQFRQDLRDRGIGNGYHGFTWTIPSDLAPGQHTVSVKFYNSATDLGSSPKTITVIPRPVITDQPDDVAVCPGHQASFSVTATGVNPRYQWYKDGLPLENIRSPKFTIVSTIATDVGAYHVVVTDECGNSVTSRTAQLSPTPAPVITGEPTDVAVCPGHPAPFSVTATGTTLRYQWYKDGRPLENIKSPKFTIVSATANDLGAYHVVVTDECGSNATSRTVRLSFKPAPVITTQPASVAVCPNHQASFTVVATGPGLLRYQWYHNSTPITGATGHKLTIVTANSSATGMYHVKVTNECGDGVISKPAILSLSSAPVITTEPSDAAVCAGQQARFSVYATGNDVRYQWYGNGVPIAGATGPGLIIVSPTAADEGLYHAVVTDKCGQRTESRKAQLSLGGAIAITKQPVNVTACAGQPVAFSAAATGGNLKYQWRRNGINISGADKSSFTIPAVSAAAGGAYTVLVYNGCDTTKESAAATLTVNAAMTLSPSSLIIDAAGGSASVGIRGSCSWTAVSNASWLTITSAASGAGSGGITYRVAANTGPARTGTMSIGGQTFTVTQQAGANAGQNNAQFVPPQTVPVSLTPGQRFNVSIKMKNTGTTTWTAAATAGGYRLVSQAPVNNTTWGLREVPLPQSVAPGAEVTFNFTITAPAAPGAYRFEWAMMQGQFSFGSFSPAIDITVR